mmetsp:Transcript_20334/g.34912  ORF Transcript_20334/g.34912 Transcript_20334/m.34912 type:complete len:335 (-) Transcript_20334:187-1191(-)|eukprot:CAMPEP_0119107336 /NCGR_PEP_ID=MMETSP1180-20130426/9647_1 /TAXON_ID=3052 ORGANISM="Chlamydomonas cf sp, Strain CCMP681" /NCGR_SAMPLE_ID=MMETSP1180 /ASSEMBLY_ACC=CAM_ASM_000741 /LENGTH=334 /DNA_ID=CAMNT_0007092809 /DNA_START=32 /DNA_END=1036 /DNA_ORIENTATION=+
MRWLVTLWLLCFTSASVANEDERLIGWRGESYAGGAAGGAAAWVELLSWEPRAFLHHNFLSASEARHIRRKAAVEMRRSTVVGPNGSSVLDPARTSYGTFIPRLADVVMARVAERVALWTNLPPVNQEDMQVLRYEVGQQYSPHMDPLIDSSPRMATVLIYLLDTEEGGETCFPLSSWVSDKTRQAAGPLSTCAEGHVAAKPKMGDALLFYSIKPDGTHDPNCLHTGCPVVAGHKWTATVWVHSQPFRPTQFVNASTAPQDSGLCKDTSDRCEAWAKSGECEHNSVFMQGLDKIVGACRAACRVCEPCTEVGSPCWQENRRKGGWLVYDKDQII